MSKNEAEKAFESVKKNFDNPVMQATGRMWYHIKIVEIIKDTTKTQMFLFFLIGLANVIFFAIGYHTFKHPNNLVIICQFFSLLAGMLMFWEMYVEACEYKLFKRKLKSESKKQKVSDE